VPSQNPALVGRVCSLHSPLNPLCLHSTPSASGSPITNRQKFVALSSLVKGLSLKVTCIKCPQTSDDSLFASGSFSSDCNILDMTPLRILPAPAFNMIPLHLI